MYLGLTCKRLYLIHVPLHGKLPSACRKIHHDSEGRTVQLLADWMENVGYTWSVILGGARGRYVKMENFAEEFMKGLRRKNRGTEDESLMSEAEYAEKMRILRLT